MSGIKRKWVVAIGTVVLVVLGGYFYLQPDSGNNNILDQSGPTMSATSSAETHSLLSRAMWDLLEKKVSGNLAEKLKSVDLSKYWIVRVEPVTSWQAGSYTGGMVDVIMQHKEAGTYDWLSFQLQVRDQKLIHAEIQIPDYTRSIRAVTEQDPRVLDFVQSVFPSVSPEKFGYRYRSQFHMPNMDWNFKKASVIGQNGEVYLVELKYDVQYAQQQKDLTSLVVIRDFKNKKMQIEDIKVVQQP